MRDPENILQEASDHHHLEWSTHSMLRVLCEYVSNQQDEATFVDFVERYAQDEADASPTL